MKKSTLLLLFIFSSVLVIAQNYQAVRSDRITFFADDGNRIKAMRIDSVKYQNDSIFFPFKNIEQVDYECYTPYGASWMGDKIVIQSDGWNIFFNKEDDSIKINTQAKLNESWTAYEIKDSIKVMAEIIDHDTLHFLRQTDSVKTIGFQVYKTDSAIVPADHPLNEMQLKLSKNFGFVTTFNFLLFPDLRMFGLNEAFSAFTLAGLTNPKLGVQNLTKFDVYDFQVGDELHTRSRYSDWHSPDYGFTEVRETIFSYLDRVDHYPDSIVYTVAFKSSIKKTTKDSVTYRFESDTLNEVIIPDSIFDKLPGELTTTDFGATYYDMWVGVSKSPGLDEFGYSNDSCLVPLIIDDDCNDTYMKGLGGPYYDCFISIQYSLSKNLVYYKKGNKSWGEHLIITGIPDKEKAAQIEVYPNPARERLWIKATAGSLPYNLELINLQGQVILQKRIDLENASVELSQFNNGVYLYRVFNDKGVQESGRLVISKD